MEISLADLKTILNTGPSELPMTVGKQYFIRTVTHYYVGMAVNVIPMGVWLTSASWVEHTGRFGEALKAGELNEVERYPGDVFVHFGAMCDHSEWPHKLPENTR